MSSAETLPEVSSGEGSSQTSSEHEVIEKKNMDGNICKKPLLIKYQQFQNCFSYIAQNLMSLSEILHTVKTVQKHKIRCSLHSR